MKKNVFYIGYGPNNSEIRYRDKYRICTSIKINKNGETEFYCNNIAEPYEVIFPPMAKPIKIWQTDSMICNNCLNSLKEKFKIDFKQEIPLLIINKGWNSSDKYEYQNYTLIKDLKNKIKIDTNVFFDPEHVWWNSYEHLLGIPIYWLKNFVLYKTFTKGSIEQGKYDGPDYIFKNTKNNKLIGFEIVSYKWNFLNSFREIAQVKKFAKNKIFHSKSFNDQIEEMKKIVNNKSNKKYFECDEIYLGIVVNNTLIDYEYYILELVLSKYIKENNLNLNGVFIL